MERMDIADGGIILGDKQCAMIAAITPIPDGAWVSLGYPGDTRSLLIDHTDWDQFVVLVLRANSIIKEELNG
jgi:hypothetical protein